MKTSVICSEFSVGSEDLSPSSHIPEFVLLITTPYYVIVVDFFLFSDRL